MLRLVVVFLLDQKPSQLLSIYSLASREKWLILQTTY